MAWGRSPSLYLLNTKQLFHVRDEKSSGTNAGGFTSGAYRTRTLNTVKTNTVSGASLASDQMTLPAGTYFIQARCPAYAVDSHKAKLYNTTASADVIVGSSASSPDTGSGTNFSFIEGLFTLSATSALELRHRSAVTQNTNGFGSAQGFGEVEVYAEAIIWKVN